MIVFDEEQNCYLENERVGTDGSILLFKKNDLNNIDIEQLKRSERDKLSKILKNCTVGVDNCFSTLQISQILDKKVPTIRRFIQNLLSAGFAKKEANFLHKHNSRIILYIFTPQSNEKNAVTTYSTITSISNMNRQLTLVGDSNPVESAHLSINENGLLQALFQDTAIPRHTSFASCLRPLTKKNNITFTDYEVKHSEEFSSKLTAIDKTEQIADIEHLRFLYVIINLTISYFERHKKQFIVKDEIEAICSIDRDQMLTWLMMETGSEYWKDHVDRYIKIWANTEFQSVSLFNKQFLKNRKTPLFRIEYELANRIDAKYPEIYVLRWDKNALQFILSEKGPYVLPWSVMAGSNLAFILYIDARKKWPGKASVKQKYYYDHEQLMNLFPVFTNKGETQTDEQFIDFVIVSLYEHISKVNIYLSKNKQFKTKNYDHIKFYDRISEIIDFKSVKAKKRYVSRIQAYIGGIMFNFDIEGIGKNKKIYTRVDYKKNEVIFNSLPEKVRSKTFENSSCLSIPSDLKKFGYYTVSAQYYSSDEITLNIHKIINPRISIKQTQDDKSYLNIPENIINIVKDERQTTELTDFNPMLAEHAEEVLPEFLEPELPPVVKPKTVRNVKALPFKVARFPSGRSQPEQNHLWITINHNDKSKQKLLLSYYSTEDDIKNTIKEICHLTHDYEERVSERIYRNMYGLKPIHIGQYLIDKNVMNDLFRNMNTVLSDNLKLKNIDLLYSIICNNKKHIITYSEKCNPLTEPLEFVKLFQHYFK